MTYHNFTRDNVNKWMNFHRTSVGWPKTKWRKLHYTRTPSVQGVWSPFTNMDPRLNITKFPDVSYFFILLVSKSTILSVTVCEHFFFPMRWLIQ